MLVTMLSKGRVDRTHHLLVGETIAKVRVHGVERVGVERVVYRLGALRGIQGNLSLPRNDVWEIGIESPVPVPVERQRDQL